MAAIEFEERDLHAKVPDLAAGGAWTQVRLRWRRDPLTGASARILTGVKLQPPTRPDLTELVAKPAFCPFDREHLETARPAEDEIGEPDTPADRDLVGRYAAAFENADMAGLVALLREDAVLEMPPLPGWFRGRAAVARFLGIKVMRGMGEFQMMPTAANGQPALAAYQRDQAGVYRAHAIQVLTPTGSGLARIVSFNDPRLFEVFGLPETTDRSA